MFHMIRLSLGGFALSALCAFTLYAPESFLAPAPAPKRKSPGAMRQELLERSANCLKLSGKLIETVGRVQQELCILVEQLAAQDKQAPIMQATQKQLPVSVERLTARQGELESAIKSQLEFLQFLKCGAVPK